MQLSEDQLITMHASLVRRQALAMVARLPANVELDDLIQAGMMGLLHAARNYEKQDNAKFETYAVARIRGSILDELRSQDWLPRSVRSQSRAIERALQDATNKLLRQPTEQEIADEMGLSINEYQDQLQEAQGAQILMYEDLVELSENSEIADTINSDNNSFNPIDLLTQQSLRKALINAIKALPEREQILLSLQFEEDLNQKEIAAVMSISEGRVSQLRSQAVARIRTWLKNNSWDTNLVSADYVDNLL